MVLLYTVASDGSLTPTGKSYENTDEFVKANKDKGAGDTYALIKPFSVVSFEQETKTKAIRTTFKGE